MTAEDILGLGDSAEPFVRAFYDVGVKSRIENGNVVFDERPYSSYADHLLWHLEGIEFPPDNDKKMCSVSGWEATHQWLKTIDVSLVLEAFRIADLAAKSRLANSQSKRVIAERALAQLDADASKNSQHTAQVHVAITRAEALVTQALKLLEEKDAVIAALQARMHALEAAMVGAPESSIARDMAVGGLTGYALGRLL